MSDCLRWSTVPPGVHIVSSFEELVNAPYPPGVNALYWARSLPGDFAEIANALPPDEGIVPVDEETLLQLTLSPEGSIARNILLTDLELMRGAELTPVLDVIHPHERPKPEGLIPTDVASWHVDSATAPADTYICTYTGATSEGLAPGQAIPRVEIPETRAALLAEYGGADDGGFQEYLEENFYTFHYLPRPEVTPYTFRAHAIYRLAIAYPDNPTAPCVHRAPLTTPRMARRLLLLS